MLACSLGLGCAPFSAAPPVGDAGSEAGAASDPPRGADASSDVPAGPGQAARRLVWVYGGVIDADEVSEGGGADAKCTAELRTVAPGRDAVAWVTVDGVGPLSRLGAAEGRWIRPDNSVVFPSRGDITGGRLMNPIDRLIDGAVAAGKVWTGVHADGLPGADCANWSTQNGTLDGLVGLIGATDQTWSEQGPTGCDASKLRILCFEK